MSPSVGTFETVRKRLFPLIVLFAAASAAAAGAPFHRGVNLTNWLQASSPRRIQFTKFTREDFVRIQSLGCDVIRLPINLHFMTSGDPGITLDPLFLRFLDEIVGWSEELRIHLLLDNHTFDPAIPTSPNVGDTLVAVWTQLAERYRDRSRFIYYEVLNEPHGLSDKEWNGIQKRVIDAIRSIDSTHAIVVGGSGWNGVSNLNLMPVYADTNLIYTFHFYDPFLFTHQGASWTDPSLESLAGVPFPFDAARMPACPSDLLGSWVQGSLSTSYRTDGTVQRLRQLLDIASNFGTRRKVPLFCGEFGVYIPNSPAEDRIAWYGAVRGLLEERGIAWTTWDYTGGFGLFEAGSSEQFDTDLNLPLLEALGLNTPEQREPSQGPDSTGFVLYDDAVGPGIEESSWASSGIFDFYSETDPVEGRYCLYWTDVPQYSNLGFSFKPFKDLTRLVSEGYAIDFWVKGDTPDSRLDIRFIDTKTEDPDDHPWRMRYTLDESVAAWDGTWNHLQIPLEDFTEHGSWDDGWFEPRGDFDWAAVSRFEIVSEHHGLEGMQFWFDRIRIVDPRNTGVLNGASGPPSSAGLLQNYPNPFNASTVIRFRTDGPGDATLTVFGVTGRAVKTFLLRDAAPGGHVVVWDGVDASGTRAASGVYLCLLEAPGLRMARKLVVLP
jgi:endoglucanase